MNTTEMADLDVLFKSPIPPDIKIRLVNYVLKGFAQKEEQQTSGTILARMLEDKDNMITALRQSLNNAGMQASSREKYVQECIEEVARLHATIIELKGKK